ILDPTDVVATADGQVPGVELQAAATETILAGRAPRTTSPLLDAAQCVAVGALAVLLERARRHLGPLAAIAALVLVALEARAGLLPGLFSLALAVAAGTAVVKWRR